MEEPDLNKPIKCTTCGAAMKRESTVCEYCGTEYGDAPDIKHSTDQCADVSDEEIDNLFKPESTNTLASPTRQSSLETAAQEAPDKVRRKLFRGMPLLKGRSWAQADWVTKSQIILKILMVIIVLYFIVHNC